MKRCWILILLVGTTFGQNKDASVTGHDWNNFNESLKTGYALGFVNGTALGAIREANLCFQLVNISLGIVNSSNDFFKQWKEKYPDLAFAATSQMLVQANRPEFKEEFCLKSFSSGFEKITVGQFVGGVNEFFQDYRNQNLPVNYALQYVRDEINGKSPAELNADLLWERRCIADPKNCTETKPVNIKLSSSITDGPGHPNFRSTGPPSFSLSQLSCRWKPSQLPVRMEGIQSYAMITPTENFCSRALRYVHTSDRHISPQKGHS